MAGSPQDSSNASSAEPPSIMYACSHFFRSSSGPGSLWPQFIYFLNLSAEQEQRLRQHSLQVRYFLIPPFLAQYELS